MSISVRNVSKKYGSFFALKDISFEVRPSTVTGFLGPNGAGKSTMMRIITCYQPPSAGEVIVCGNDIREKSIEVRKSIGYLPENNPLYIDMYVKEYLQMVAGIYGLGKKKDIRIKEIMDRTGLENEGRKKIGVLSKGFKQRVGLAQAMIHDPKVLILDEPTSGLDPNQLLEIRKLIIELGKEKTVLLSTHVMQEVEAVCNHVIIINEGKIVEDSPLSTLNRSGKDYHVFHVEFDKPADSELIKQLPFVKSALNKNSNEWKIAINSKEDVRGDLFEFAVNNGLKVLTMKEEDSGLEDIFHERTAKKF